MLRRKTNSAITNYIRKDFMYTKYLYKYYINTLSIHIHIYTNITTLLLVSIKNGLSENKVERPFLYFSFCHDSIWLVMRNFFLSKSLRRWIYSYIKSREKKFSFPISAMLHSTFPWYCLGIVSTCVLVFVCPGVSGRMREKDKRE